jgi:hypothetical protein
MKLQNQRQSKNIEDDRSKKQVLFSGLNLKTPSKKEKLKVAFDQAQSNTKMPKGSRYKDFMTRATKIKKEMKGVRVPPRKIRRPPPQ